MKKTLTILLLSIKLFGLISCSSVGDDGEEREFERDYVVIDAKYERFPGWVNEPRAWAEQNDEDDFENYQYYVSSTPIVKNMRLCTKSADAQATATVAAEISQFVKNSYAQSVQGDGDSEVEAYMEDTLAQEVQSYIVGAQVYRSYWEKRKYKKELGSEFDRIGLVCSALVKIKRSYITKSLEMAQKKLVEGTSNPESKEKVRKALDYAKEKFETI